MLRKALPEDFDFIYELYMHPSVNPWLLYDPMSKENFCSIYHDLLDKQVKYVFIKDGLNAGMVKFIPYSFRIRHIAYVGGLAIHPSFNGRGYGHELMKSVLQLAKTKGFRRLELSVIASNEKAIRLYKQAGFEQEGVLRNYTYLAAEDRYIDEIMMGLLL